jgi:hypothetical protein
MLLKSPVLITSRLLPGVQLPDGTISITYSRRSGSEGRTRFQWFIDLDNGAEFEGDDLQSGAMGGNLQSGLESLLSFLGACAESYAYDIRRGGDGTGGDNSDLFPLAVAEWAHQHSDELSMLACELSETADLIDE